jgi:hypothetical protein
MTSLAAIESLQEFQGNVEVVVPPALIELHRGLNRDTAENWHQFADHRARVTALAPGGDTCAVLGAGNCNDLDLEALAQRYREIHLMDLDGEALERAIARQPAAIARRLVLHPPVDLSGALHRLASFRRTALTPAELGALPQSSADAVLHAIEPRFDTVLSTCVLSQIMHTCNRALGAGTPQLEIIACALVVAHLRVVTGLLRPGGVATLVTDTVSSESYALEELWGERTPLELLDHLEQTQNFLSGTSVSFLRRILRSDEVISKLIYPPRLVEPWLWRLNSQFTLLAYALTFCRRV